jgi:hypothetical protein
MKTMKTLGVACIGLALLMVFSATRVQAQGYYYFNPLFLPFAVAGAAIGTAAAITTGIVAPAYPYPAYYGPGPSVYYRPAPYYHRTVWVRGHHHRHGAWGPGHWRH